MTKSIPTFKQQTFTGTIVKNSDPKRLASGAYSIISVNSLQYNYPLIFQQYLNLSCRPGDNITITLTNKRPKRTKAQNDYYWLYLGLISLSSGHPPEELHSWAKGKFLSTGITEIFGDKTRKVKSTTKLTRPEFCEYICRIEENTEIPAPKTEPFMKALTHAEYAKLTELQRIAYEKLKTKIVIQK